MFPRKFPKRKQKDSPENSGNVTFGDWIHRLYHVIFFQKNRQTFGRSGTNSGKAPNGMAVLEEPQGSFQEMSKFVSSYNQAGKKIEELLGNVERESRLKEKAHYEMLMSQISPHFIFNTVNSIRIMAVKEGQDG